MEIKRIWAIYFSSTWKTKRVVEKIAETIAENHKMEVNIYDFTLPKNRKSFAEVKEGDLVVFGMPTYAGRVPNLMLKYLDTIEGNGALAVPVVTFGNRAFDNSLIELRNILEAHNFHTIAGAACASEHSFSYTLGEGRPDYDDLVEVVDFANKIDVKVESLTDIPAPIAVAGDDTAGYFKPQDGDKKPIDIRKVKPKTNIKCTVCGMCARNCPMGSISPDNVMDVVGICIKCNACVKRCPVQAKYFDDPGYLYHKENLEELYADTRQPNSFYI